MLRHRIYPIILIATITVLAAGGRAGFAASSQIAGAEGAVYAASNAVHHNTVLAYHRAADGSLTYIAAYKTGGRGSGGTIDPLQSQGSMVVSPDHNWLFVVNSGSGDISTFAIHGDGSLKLTAVEASDGGFPVSLAVWGHLLYVLNAGGMGDVAGFYIRRSGDLSPIPGSIQFLSATSAGGSSIDFSPDGSALAAVERLTDKIDIFPIGDDGVALPAVQNPSNGAGAFSAVFTPQAALLVAETAGNPAGGSAVSSYWVGSDDMLSVISGSVPTGYNAACWIAATSDGHYAFVANAGSSEISSFSIADNGSISLLGATGSGAGSTPLDVAISGNNRYVYVSTAGDGSITSFEVQANGALTPLDKTQAFTAASGQNGLAAF